MGAVRLQYAAFLYYCYCNCLMLWGRYACSMLRFCTTAIATASCYGGGTLAVCCVFVLLLLQLPHAMGAVRLQYAAFLHYCYCYCLMLWGRYACSMLRFCTTAIAIASCYGGGTLAVCCV